MKRLVSRLLLPLSGLLVVALFVNAQDENRSKQTSKPAGELLKKFAAEFVDITPGKGKFPAEFRMGSKRHPSESPVKTIKMTTPFAMARYEVTQELYAAIMGKNPSVWGGPRNSVEMVSYQDAAQFCQRATLQMRRAQLLKDNEVIRLPTEAEWEYCCRAGSTTEYSFGDSATAAIDSGKQATLLDPWAWHTGNAAGNDPPVGALKPNAWGLYDMHGYLWEYCSDAWRPTYNSQPATNQRVIRSGSWRDHYSQLRSATRWSIPDHVKSDAIGFRCVKASPAS